MKVLDAVEKILHEARRPLHYQDITRVLLRHGLWRSRGRTPWHTVKSRLVEDISKRGDKSRFRRFSRGIYGLDDMIDEVRAEDAHRDLESAQRWIGKAMRDGWALETRRNVSGWFGFARFCPSVRAELRELCDELSDQPGEILIARTADDQILLLHRETLVDENVPLNFQQALPLQRTS